MGERKVSFHVVDDDPAILKLITAILTDAGHKVCVSESSALALEEIVSNPPDAVLVDIMMPELDGLELVKRLRALPEMASTKIIVISGKGYEYDRRRARDMGADAYLTKPLKRETFLDQILEVIRDKVELKYWGVRGTLPVSGERSLRYGGNTNCVTMSFQNEQLFIFDAGSGIKEFGTWLMKQKRRVTGKIFISHPHWDHVNALPFFVPLYIQGNEFEILGSAHGDLTMRELIGAQMDGVYFPITMREFGARVYFRNIGTQVLDIDGIMVETMLLNHPGYCLGYRVTYRGRSIAYITDNELYYPNESVYDEHYVDGLINFIRNVDVLITDTTYTDKEYVSKVGWGHSCIGQVVDVAHRAGVGELHLFHHDPDQDDDAIDAKLAEAQAALDALGSKTRVIAPAEGTSFFV